MLKRLSQTVVSERAFEVLPWIGVVVTVLWFGLLAWDLAVDTSRLVSALGSICLICAAGTTGVLFKVRALRRTPTGRG